ncbi:MAG TPA: hypothetical protein VGH87_05780, partial [Polyangiaceae bacterium]
MARFVRIAWLGIPIAFGACGLAETGLLQDGGGADVVTKDDVLVINDDASDVTDGGAPDTASDAPFVDAAGICAATCADAGGVCLDGGACYFDCTATLACDDKITCPPSIPCVVACGYASCSNDIDCTASSACAVKCLGDTSCSHKIKCGGSACSVSCSGYGACDDD